MPPARDEIVTALVVDALAAPDATRTYEALLVRLRDAAEADRVLLAQASERGTILVLAVPHLAEPPDLAWLGAAFDAREPVALEPAVVEGGWLALGFGLRDAGRCSIAVSRRTRPWTPGDRARLSELRPYLELVLEHAALRARVAAAREQAAADAAEHERFLSVISHELRNPLAPILMWTSTLRRLRGNDAEVQRAAQAIAHAVSLERRLIEELLDFSRLERRGVELALQRVDLRDVARRTIDVQRRALAEATLALDEEFPPKPVPVRGDPVRLDQVAAELLGNAMKFTPAGGRIGVRVARLEREGELVVSDTGPGIPEQIRPRLFTAFVQGPNARGGLGLGLAVAQRLVALHGGTLVGENRPQGGASVAARLPLVGKAS